MGRQMGLLVSRTFRDESACQHPDLVMRWWYSRPSRARTGYPVPGELRLLAGDFDGFGQGRDYFEEVAYDAVVGNFEDGASASLLMATMHCEPFMPTRCWMAPEIPTAR